VALRRFEREFLKIFHAGARRKKEEEGRGKREEKFSRRRKGAEDTESSARS